MQLNRLFEILYLLLEQDHITAKDLAKHFEVSTRTIYRDVDTLSAAGIPIYMTKGSNGGIRLLPDYVLNKTVMTKEEQLEILSSLHAMNTVGIKEANTVLGKLGSLFGEQQTNWLEVDFGFWSDGNKEATLFQTLKNAILLKNVVQFTYTNSNGDEAVREVEPLKLVFKGSSWYLYGYCRIRKDYRFFKLRRLSSLLVLTDKVQQLCPEQIFSPITGQGDGTSIHAVLHIDQRAAFRVYDEFDTYTRKEDGNFLVDVNFPSYDWVMATVLSYGSDCEVLEPDSLRKQVLEEVERIYKKYTREV